jgi:hypothetical protein
MEGIPRGECGEAGLGEPLWTQSGAHHPPDGVCVARIALSLKGRSPSYWHTRGKNRLHFDSRFLYHGREPF